MWSPPLRAVVGKALALTVVLFAAVLLAAEVALSALVAMPWPWLSTLAAVATGLGLFAAFIVLMAPVTAMFAGLFLDEVADVVERRDYPDEPPGRPLAAWAALWTGLRFGLLVLAVNLALLPFLFFGIGAIVMWLGNAYLLGREYFGLIAMRHLSPAEAEALRRANASKVFAAGLVPAGLALVPAVNLLVPVFATAYFVHVFRLIRAGRANQ
jgi:CysZ protein